MDFVPAKGIFSGRILRLQDDEEVVRAPQHSGGCRLMSFDRDLSKYGGGLTVKHGYVYMYITLW
jgi:hypothetical protein